MGLRISASGSGYIEWSWNPVEGADGYEVQFSPDETFAEEDEIVVRTAAQTSYRRPSLPPGTSVFLRVRSFTGTGETRLWSEWSASVAGMTSGPAPPETPTKLHVSQIGVSYIEWRWSPVEGVEGYRIQYSLDDEVFTEGDRIVELPATERSYRVADLSPAVTVSLRVQSFVGVGTDRVESAWSTPVSRSTLGEPSESTRRRDGEFTDSQGRTIRYRLYLDRAWNTSEPRGVFVQLHGNQKATEQNIFDASGARHPQVVAKAGLAFAVVASPTSLPEGHPGELFGALTRAGGTRLWRFEDVRLFHELLQSGFNETLVVDHNAVVLWGGSAGAQLVARFFERYAGVYGGGVWMWCGGSRGTDTTRLGRRSSFNWEPLFPWNPSSSAFVKERVRVVVEGTTEDFLYSQVVGTASLYAETLGLDVRAYTDMPGGHCANGRGETTHAEVVQWLLDGGRQLRTRIAREGDADADGIENEHDYDDDNDGAPDFIDALPLDARDWLDTDGDGVGNFTDRDADGDGVDNSADPFTLDPSESADTDGDGIGDNLDDDDDNDGIRDEVDGDWSDSEDRPGGLVLTRVPNHVYPPAHASVRRTVVHSRKPAEISYPQPEGTQQAYEYLELGNGGNGGGTTIQIMVDRFDTGERCETTLLPVLCGDGHTYSRFWHDHFDKIYVDRNNNGDLTDDGAPLTVAVGLDLQSGWGLSAITMVTVSYSSGEKLPYWLGLWSPSRLADGAFYTSHSVWQGTVESPHGDVILVATLDGDTDGRFDSEESDLVCIDVDRNGILDECTIFSVLRDGTWGAFRSTRKPGAAFLLDGREHRVVVSPSGREVELIDIDSR